MVAINLINVIIKNVRTKKRVVQMKYEYIFFEEDASFDYQGAFGTETHHCKDYHGFEIEIPVDDKLDVKTLRGFGAFSDVEKCETLEQLYDYIEKNKKYVRENEDEITSYTRLECLLELQEIILENLKEQAKNGIKTDITTVCIR